MAEAPKPTPPKAEPAKNPSSEHKATAPGAVSTYSAGGGTQLPDPRGDRFLTHDEIHGLAGDIQPGELGFLKLDEEGKPQGTVIRDYVDTAKEGPVASVIASPQSRFDDIVTPSGAPITKFMNPDPTLWDEGMLARNPPPPRDKDAQRRAPAGGGVINEPVRT